MNTSRSRAGFVSERVAALAVTLSAIGFWLVVATYPSLFLFNPFLNTDPVLRVEQIVSTFAWAIFGSLTVLTAWIPRVSKYTLAPVYTLASLLWPTVVLVIQVTLAIKGYGFYAYLGSYPIMAFNDIVAPVLLLALRDELFYKN